MKVSQEMAWAGTESSLKAALEAEERSLTANYPGDSGDSEIPRLITSTENGVATITIRGPLVNDDDEFNQYMGVTGYPEIRSALVHAAQDESVSQILLDIDSGGGSVSGVADTAKLVRLVNDSVKPVTTFTDGVMASAAYWIGSSASKVYASQTSVVGSIGVISTHMEKSKMLADNGIGVTVVRAGKYKALANSVEPLSEEGRKQIQNTVDAIYGTFVTHVAAMRNRSYDYADKTMADGQEFVGASALNVGLIDGISTFDSVMSELTSKSVDVSKTFNENRGKVSGFVSGNSTNPNCEDQDMNKRALTAQDIAAIAAGAPVQVSVEEPVQEEVNTDVAATTQPAVEAVKVETPVIDANAMVAVLQAQVVEKDKLLLDAGIEASKLRAEIEAMKATHDQLVEIAKSSVSNMAVALGSVASVEGANAVAVLAEHSRLSSTFVKKFRVGGVAAVSDTAEQVNVQKVDALTQARLNAVRPIK